MSQERLFDILRGPVVSEKAVGISQSGSGVVFKVAVDATKKEVKEAVESLFNVQVEMVRTLNVKGKKKVYRGRRGQRASWKKAYVRLQKGQSIEYTESNVG